MQICILVVPMIVEEADPSQRDKELGVVSRNSSGRYSAPDTQSQSSIDSDDIDFLDDATSEKEIVRTKVHRIY